MMTRQEVFTKVKGHLLTQGRKAFRPDEDTCAYRGEDGLACAAGCLIKDEYYDKKYEGCAVHDWSDPTGSWNLPTSMLHQALIDSGVSGSDFDLVSTLQDIHDNTEPITWATRLTKLAKLEGLKY